MTRKNIIIIGAAGRDFHNYNTYFRDKEEYNVVAFTAAINIGDLGSAPSRTSYGTGFRYLIARKFGLHAGLDIARGPEETVVYIQIGHAWSR